MRRDIVKAAVLFILILAIFSVCTSCAPSVSTAPVQHSPLPDINTFSSTEYAQTEYLFPPIKSAVYVHDGISEALNPDDPRLIRLLNSLSYSYEQGFTYWRQGYVEEAEFLTFVNSGCPMLDICFDLDAAPACNTEFSTTPRVIVSANRYLLLVDATKSSWMPDDCIYANEHFPYAGLLVDYFASASDDEKREMIGDIQWGNGKWINLLEYAGFGSNE